jgi:uncharacterized protein YqhQ
MAERFSYGGQAVIEGVMMRGLNLATVAVRAPDKQIVLRQRELNGERRRRRENIPFLRGLQLLGEALTIGTWSLMTAASIAEGADEEPMSKSAMTLAIVTSLAMAIGIFILLPALIAQGLQSPLGLTTFGRNMLEGALHLLIFIGYLGLIGLVPDIRRVFGYHGAEHKTVSAYEAGVPLTVAEVRRFSTIHPRCGTTLLLVVVALSILFLAPLSGLPFLARVLSKILMVPLITAGAYELLRLSARNYHRPWVRTLMAPALVMQRLTTREPDDSMIEVAIAALVPVLAADGKTVEATVPSVAQYERQTERVSA